jgi:lipopolysaccharide core galacturonosyltransferase RgtB
MAATNPNPFNPRPFLALLLGYFALQTLARLWLSRSVELDAAEQLVMTQSWHWGYTMQPPLYTWLQTLAFQLFGLNVFALVLLKNLLLCGTFLLTYAAARELTDNPRAAVAAMASLFLLPQIAWESQRDQTHSVLMTMLAAALLYSFLRLAKTRRPAAYLIFGLVALLGCLSKYNFAVFVVVLLLAAASLEPFRPVVWHRGMLLAGAAFLLGAAPHLNWMRSHPAELMARAGEVHEHAAQLWAVYAKGLASLVVAVAAFSGPAALIFAALFFRAPVTAPEMATPATDAGRQLTRRIFVTSLLVCAGMVFAFQAHFKDRWMQPLLFATPIFLVMEILGRLDDRRWKRLLALNGLIAVGVFVVLNSTPAWAAATGHYRYLEPDYARLAAQLRERGFNGGVIAAESRRISGNLKLYFPDSPALATEVPPVPAPRNVPWLAIWCAAEDRSIPPVDRETNMLWTLRGVDLNQEKPVLLDVPYEHGRGATARFACVLYPAAKPN